MKKTIQHTLFVIVCFLCVILASCSTEGDDDPIVNPPQEIIPSNLVLTIDVIGSDTNNPNGDGSGIIQCTATATNAVRYGYKFGSDPEQENTSGTINHTYTTGGTNSYLVTVFAYSSTNNSISSFKNATVFVDNGQLHLVWSDEFNVNGTPDVSKWNYDIGAGGWGNGESQYYTNRPENVTVDNGLLLIKAKKENYQGAEYTSARMKTEGNFDFTYGKVEVRAKLPEHQGTWPAIWMLGANFQSVGWPTCGEIDIMEQTGWDKSTVLATCHWLNQADSSNASYGQTTTVSTASTAFHIYSIEWTESSIRMYVDNSEYYVIALNSSLPFDADFFIIFNIAMGGSLGGTIAPGFTEDTMEIDYIRVYQQTL